MKLGGAIFTTIESTVIDVCMGNNNLLISLVYQGLNFYTATSVVKKAILIRLLHYPHYHYPSNLNFLIRENHIVLNSKGISSKTIFQLKAGMYLLIVTTFTKITNLN